MSELKPLDISRVGPLVEASPRFQTIGVALDREDLSDDDCSRVLGALLADVEGLEEGDAEAFIRTMVGSRTEIFQERARQPSTAF